MNYDENHCIGATGGVGKYVVQQGLDAGLEVTAFVRTPLNLKLLMKI